MEPIWLRGEGEGYPEINENMKKLKNANVDNQIKKTKVVLKCGEIFSKIRGFNGWAFTEVL